MTTIITRALIVLGLMTASTTGTMAAAKTLQCVPYARQVSGIDIRGNANTWWAQAANRYERGEAPVVGSVMSFKAIKSMPFGHVAMVSKIVSDREVLLDHANWSRRGGIERGVRAIDVSDKGDWSRVRVWFGPIGDLGSTIYPVNGFIYTGKAPTDLGPKLKSKDLASLMDRFTSTPMTVAALKSR